MKKLINGLVGFCQDYSYLPIFGAGLLNVGLALSGASDQPFWTYVHTFLASFAFVCTGWFYSEKKWMKRHHEQHLNILKMADLHMKLLCHENSHMDVNEHSDQVRPIDKDQRNNKTK